MKRHGAVNPKITRLHLFFLVQLEFAMFLFLHARVKKNKIFWLPRTQQRVLGSNDAQVG